MIVPGISPQLHMAAERLARELPDDERGALLAAFESVTESTTVDALLTDLFHRLGYGQDNAQRAAIEVLSETPIDLRRGLN